MRYCEHPTRKLRNGGADRYFTIRYRLGGKIREDGLGWASEGWNAQKSHAMRSKLREAQKTGEGPKTIEAMRAAAKKAEELRVETEKCENITLDDFAVRNARERFRQTIPGFSPDVWDRRPPQVFL